MTTNRSVRKPDKRFGGLQVRICGRMIQKEGNIVCGLPPHYSNSYHAAIALTDEGAIVALVQLPGSEVEIWQLVGPPE